MSILEKIEDFAADHDNLLLTIGKVALTAGLLYFSVRNTVDCIDDESKNTAAWIITDDCETKGLTIPEEVVCPKEDPTTRKAKAKRIFKHYWPTAACFVSLVGLEIYEGLYFNDIRKSYAEALIGAQSAALIKKDDILKIDEKEAEKTDEGEAEQAAKYYYRFFYNPDEMPEEREFARGYANQEIDTLFLIPDFGIAFYSGIDDVNEGENRCVLQIESGADLYWNDILENLGLSRSGIGRDFAILASEEGIFDLREGLFELSPGMTTDKDSPELFYTIHFNLPFTYMQ